MRRRPKEHLRSYRKYGFVRLINKGISYPVSIYHRLVKNPDEEDMTAFERMQLSDPEEEFFIPTRAEMKRSVKEQKVLNKIDKKLVKDALGPDVETEFETVASDAIELAGRKLGKRKIALGRKVVEDKITTGRRLYGNINNLFDVKKILDENREKGDAAKISVDKKASSWLGLGDKPISVPVPQFMKLVGNKFSSKGLPVPKSLDDLGSRLRKFSAISELKREWGPIRKSIKAQLDPEERKKIVSPYPMFSYDDLKNMKQFSGVKGFNFPVVTVAYPSLESPLHYFTIDTTKIKKEIKSVPDKYHPTMRRLSIVNKPVKAFMEMAPWVEEDKPRSAWTAAQKLEGAPVVWDFKHLEVPYRYRAARFFDRYGKLDKGGKRIGALLSVDKYKPYLGRDNYFRLLESKIIGIGGRK